MSIAGYAPIKVEVFFDLSALDSDGLFIIGSSTIGGTDLIAGEVATDITSACYEVSTSAGRSRELDVIPTGTATVRLRNYDGNFLPEELNALSPYVGQVLPGKRVRISMAANDRPIFTGRIDDWRYDFDVSGRVDAQFECVDALGQLASMSFNDWTSTAGQTPGERLDDVLDRPEVDWGPSRDLGTGVVTLQSDAVTWGSNVLNYCSLVAATDRGFFFAARDGKVTYVGRDELALRATLFGSPEDDRHLVLGPFTTTPTNFLTGSWTQTQYTTRPDTWSETISFYLETLTDQVNLSGTRTAESGVQVNANGGIVVYQNDEDGNPFRVYSEFSLVEAGRRYWLRSTIDFTDPTNNNSLELSTDGVNFFEVGGYKEGNSAKDLITLDGLQQYQVGHYSTDPTDDMEEVRVYSWSRSYTHSTEGDRSVGFTNNDIRDLGLVTFGAGEPAAGIGTTNLDVYSGVVVVGGNEFNDSNASTFADDGNGIPFTNIEVTSSSELLFNRVGVNRENGALQTVSSTASQEAYGVRSIQLTGLLMETDDQAESLARYLLDSYSRPQVRVSSVTVALDSLDPASARDYLAPLLEIGEIVKVHWTPTGGEQLEQLSVVEGRQHHISYDGLHMVRYALSPADSLAGFIIGDARFGVIGQSRISF